jgi:hypothetical protein
MPIPPPAPSTAIEHLIPPEPWERQTGESDMQFAAFSCFRDLGPARTISAAARKMGRTAGAWHQWSRDWKWNERATEWDDHVDRVRRVAHMRQVEDMNARQAREAELIQRALATPARLFLERITSDPKEAAKLRKLPVEKLVALMTKAAAAFPNVAKAEREAVGVVQGEEVREKDFDRMDTRELLARFGEVNQKLVTAMREHGINAHTFVSAGLTIEGQPDEMAAGKPDGARPPADAVDTTDSRTDAPIYEQNPDGTFERVTVGAGGA